MGKNKKPVKGLDNGLDEYLNNLSHHEKKRLLSISTTKETPDGRKLKLGIKIRGRF